MAIDSMLYAVSIADGTSLVAGQNYPATLVRGPSVVRDGYGTPIMKRIFTSSTTSGNPSAHISIKNQNWVDEICNATTGISVTTLANTCATIQRCGDIELQPNSAFDVNFVPDVSYTTSGAFDIFILIDIDYPSVNAIANPKEEKGYPMTIYQVDSITTTAIGSATTAVWTSVNKDFFKAGYRYLLAESGFRTGASGATLGFISFSGASGQAGLERIVPVNASAVASLRYDIDYSTPLVKGPMYVNYMLMATSSATTNAYAELDFIKR